MIKYMTIMIIKFLGNYSTHVFTDEAIRIIKSKDKDKPFFMYLNFMGVHAPLQVL